jgi:hypothetical protein
MVLAGALVCARAGQYCDKTRLALLSAIGTENDARWLAVGRNMLSYTIAADVMRNSGNLTGTDLNTVSTWLASFLTRTLKDNNSSNQETLTPFESGSNASAQEGAVYAAMAAYTNNSVKLEYVWNRFRLFSCDRAGNPEQTINLSTGFGGGWSHTTVYSQACAVNPIGTTKDGHRIDGAVINDIVRGGSFKWPPSYTNYVWTGLQGYVSAATVLDRAGFPSFEVKDQAVFRAVEYLCYLKNNTSTDWWQPGHAPAIKHLALAAYGNNLAGCGISYPVGDGMIIGYTDWTHPVGVAVTPVPVTPATASPTASSTLIPPSLTPTRTATPSLAPVSSPTFTNTPTNTPTFTPVPPSATALCVPALTIWVCDKKP